MAPDQLGRPTEQEVLAKQEAQNPLDLHAQMFSYYSPLFLNGLQHLGKKALIRLIGSLIQVPLNDREIRLRSKHEQDMFNMGDQLLTSKYVMIIVTDAEAQRQRVEAEETKRKEKEFSDEVMKSLDKPIPSVIELDNNGEIKKGESNGEQQVQENSNRVSSEEQGREEA